VQKAPSVPCTTSSSQPSQPSADPKCSTAATVAAPPNSMNDDKLSAATTSNLSKTVSHPPVLSSKQLADSHEHNKLESSQTSPPAPKLALPTVIQPRAGLNLAAFLNQGESEDSDEEVWHPVACLHVLWQPHSCSAVQDSTFLVTAMSQFQKWKHVRLVLCVQFNF
jgi:hypothetical protein